VAAERNLGDDGVDPRCHVNKTTLRLSGLFSSMI